MQLQSLESEMNNMSEHKQDKLQETYQIQVQGWFSERWAEPFSGMTVSRLKRGAESAPITVLSGPVVDQAALRGILNKLWDLNLSLVSVHRLDDKG